MRSRAGCGLKTVPVALSGDFNEPEREIELGSGQR